MKPKKSGSCPACKRQLRLEAGSRKVCDGECKEALKSIQVRNVLFRALGVAT